MNRRDFVIATGKIIALSSLGMSSISDAFSKGKYKKITILHTNDTHSRIEAFPSDGRKYSGMGGVAQRARLIQKIRETEKNVLLLDAGDIFQGTPYFNFFGGELEFKLMSMMKYDAATLGNHDFDNGLEGLKKMLPHAKFPFVNANYDFSQTILKDTFEPYHVFEKEGVKIGVFGLGVELDGLVSKKLTHETTYLDPIETAQNVVKILKDNEKCQIIICLSHLGFDYPYKKVSDKVLAQNVDGIDLIIGGHTHTFLEQSHIELSPNSKKVLINQVGWAGIQLGRIDFYVSYQHEPPIFEHQAINIVDNVWKNS